MQQIRRIAMTLASSLNSYAKELAHWWQVQREKIRDIEALRAMSLPEIEELTGEMGLSRSQLEALVKAGPEGAVEMDRMMAALDIDPAAVQSVHPATMRDMRITCATCADKSVCRHTLADGTATALLTSFCPNSEELLDFAKRPDLCST
jgi:hypothetical protein